MQKVFTESSPIMLLDFYHSLLRFLRANKDIGETTISALENHCPNWNAYVSEIVKDISYDRILYEDVLATSHLRKLLSPSWNVL